MKKKKVYFRVVLKRGSLHHNINEFMVINNHTWNKKDSKEVFKLLSSKENERDNSLSLSKVLNDKDLYNLFQKQGFVEDFEKGFDKIKSILKKTKNIIEHEDKGLNDLFNYK